MDLSRTFEIKNFVFASSSSVYGLSENEFFREDDDTDKPVSPYAATKRSCEHWAHAFHLQYGLNITALRFFTVFGPRGRPDMAPFKFIDSISKGKAVTMYGDGSTSRDYTYVADIVDGVVRALDRPHGFEIFNLGKGNGTKLGDFVKLLEKHTGKQANIKRLEPQAGDVPYTQADISKATCLLGYKPKVTTDEGIKKTVEWYNSYYGKK